MSLADFEYIPIGVLYLDNLNNEIFVRNAPQWRRFHDELESNDPQSNTDASILLTDEENAILNHRRLRPYNALLGERWIKLIFGLGGDNEGIVRVHFLPDDRYRHLISRDNPRLKKARNKLMGELDVSAAAWNGQKGRQDGADSHSDSHPESHTDASPNEGDGGEDGEQSLLHLFNMIPSPSPSADNVQDPDAQAAILSLFESRIPGLITELYPYQRRSAAMILQRENAPGKVLDPRLTKLEDHDGQAWYHDPIGGTVLRNPQHYDGITGGILAEQMGAGKTLICLSVVLASRRICLAPPPDLYRVRGRSGRMRCVPSLMRIAALCATSNGVPWRYYFDVHDGRAADTDWSRCIEELSKVPGYYLKPSALEEVTRVATRNSRGHPVTSNKTTQTPLPIRVFLSTASLIIVPPNLLLQWMQEIDKHTQGLKVVAVSGTDCIPPARTLIEADIVLFSLSRFERILDDDKHGFPQHIRFIHFKRCIIDEGHKLGNSGMTHKSKLLQALDMINIGHRWIVTGTPSKGLYGVEGEELQSQTTHSDSEQPQKARSGPQSESEQLAQERLDLYRIGAMTKHYLKARPWSNTADELGDTVADWKTYVAHRQHRRKHVLQETLNSLIIRHRLCDISTVLPTVNEKIVRLEGSYQDRLSLNVFYMMIIFNAVQSQRTDQDYFFHTRQRRFLLELVRNMRQATFFGGMFFPKKDVIRAVQTAREFVATKAKGLGVGADDMAMLQEAIKIGDLALGNHLRVMGGDFHEIPLLVADLPLGAEKSWTLDGKMGNVSWTLGAVMHVLQNGVREALKSQTAWNTFVNGKMAQMGSKELSRILMPPVVLDNASMPPLSNKEDPVLAGSTTIGSRKGEGKKMSNWSGPKRAQKEDGKAVALPDEFAKTRLVATASAKMSYLIDSIGRHQDKEQIIVFYDNENIAWHLASAFDLVGFKYLIYAKSLSVGRRAQYVESFIKNSEFRILLMDIAQAAFGLDIRVATRIYFLNPILDPQVEAQAIGRARRVSQQQGQVTVETLILRDSIDEVVVERRARMSAIEHRQCKTVLDDRPIANWIKNVRILGMGDGGSYETEMCMLEDPKPLFGQAGVESPDDGLVGTLKNGKGDKPRKRALNEGPLQSSPATFDAAARLSEDIEERASAPPGKKSKRRKIAFA